MNTTTLSPVPVIVTHCGSTQFSETFDWANYQDTLTGKIVLTIGCTTQPDSLLWRNLLPHDAVALKNRLSQLHLCKIDKSSEVLILNLTDYIGSSTVHELCYAANHQRQIRWLEDWPMYCSTCRFDGPMSEHFFHNVLPLNEFERLSQTLEIDARIYLEGMIVDWHGMYAPVVMLEHNELAFLVDIACPGCEGHRSWFVVAQEGQFQCQLIGVGDGGTVVDLCDADHREQHLLCPSCAQQEQAMTSVMWLL